MLPYLITAKLEPPLLSPSWVPREDLMKKLNGGMHQGHKVIVITAPEGSGKTTLVASWLAQSDYAYTWLSLTADENDPIVFMLYLVAALQKIDPEIGVGLQGAWLMKQPNPDRLMMALVSDIARKQKEFILVLDDYHVINSPMIHRLVGILLEHSPVFLRIVVASSSEPPLALTPWRASRQLTELRALDLRFSRIEIRELALQVIGAPLTPDVVQNIRDCSGGWPAGVHLAARLLQLRREQSSTGNSHSESLWSPAKLPLSAARPGAVDEEAANLLLQTVFDQLPEEARHALLRASSVKWVSADHTLGDAFPLLFHDSLFAHSYAGWARLHLYWQNFLAARLNAAFPQATIAELHASASHFYETRGCIDEAIYHALAGAEPERPAELIKNEIEHAFWRQGSALRLRLCLNRLPKPVLSAHPGLALQFAQAMFFLEDFHVAEFCLQLAREGSEAGENQNGLRAELAALQACLLQVRGEAELFMELATHMLARRSDLTPLSTMLLLYNLGLAMVQRSDLLTAREKFDAVYRQALDAGNVLMELAALIQLAKIELMSGRLQEVERFCLQGLAICSKVGEAVNLYAGLLSVYLGDVYYEWNRLTDAARLYQMGVNTGARFGFRPLFSLSCSSMVRLLVGRGETNRTDIWMRALHELEQSPVSDENLPLAWLVARLEFRRGNLEAASLWAKRFHPHPISSCTYDEMLENETWVQIQVALGQQLQEPARLRQALAAVASLLVRAEAVGWMPVVLRLHILQALVYKSLGDCPRAVDSLSTALELAVSAGFIRTLIDEGQPVVELLREACLQHISHDYFQMLFDALPKPSGTVCSYTKLLPTDSLSNRFGIMNASSHTIDELEKENLLSLTSREQDVLSLLASGLSYEETAGKLVITVNTVRTHIKSIYRKLGVSSRGRAVQEASRLGILAY